MAMRRLSKRDVEALLGEYDNNPVAALHAALSILIPDCPKDWSGAVDCLQMTEAAKQSLRDHDTAALDALVKQFVETRSL